MSPHDKPLVWMHGEITTPPFSANARIEAGYLLRLVQMEKRKKNDLESKGYKIGSVEEFLGLSTKESEYIELKLALSEALAKRRKKSNLTQAQLAKLLKSSQSRVAKMEKGDPTVSVDLLVKSLLALGADKKSIARAIA